MAKTIVDQLIDAGIPARAYARGPLGKESFVISINRRENPAGLIRVFEPANSETEVIVDKAKQQAVINVKDPTRKLTRTVNVWGMDEETAKTNAISGRYNPFAGVTFPRTPRYTAKINKELKDSPHHGTKHWEAEVTATVPSSEQSFLVGMDETANFVAMTKKNRNDSVEDAHAALRPLGASEDTLRQGEWFFVPISDAEWRRVEQTARVVGPEIDVPLESQSTHRAAQIVRHEGNIYAIGYIIDSRAGHHAPLFLDDWHRVNRNGEVVATPQQQRARRSRTWD